MKFPDQKYFFNYTMGATEFVELNWDNLPEELRWAYTNETFGLREEIEDLDARLRSAETDAEDAIEHRNYARDAYDLAKQHIEDLNIHIKTLKNRHQESSPLEFEKIDKMQKAYEHEQNGYF